MSPESQEQKQADEASEKDAELGHYEYMAKNKLEHFQKKM